MNRMNNPKGILLLTGTVGTGKTTVASTIGDQLADIGLPNAVIDLDWLGWVNVGDDFHKHDHLIMQNLLSTWRNYRSVGVEYLVLARALLHREPVDILINAFPDTPITIIRLTASHETIKERLSKRDSDEVLREHLAEMEKMDQVMDALRLEQTTVATGAISVEEAAGQVISIAGWKP